MKRSHSGPTIPAAERAARGQRQKLVRMSEALATRVEALQASGHTLAEIVEAGVVALETK